VFAWFNRVVKGSVDSGGCNLVEQVIVAKLARFRGEVVDEEIGDVLTELIGSCRTKRLKPEISIMRLLRAHL
jgi:hypothetical protein